ncbi:MAG TPA: DUF4157 domain-containing protein [Gammaproteobacteria bacterium]
MDREPMRPSRRAKAWVVLVACIGLTPASPQAANDEPSALAAAFDLVVAGLSLGTAAAGQGLAILQAEMRRIDPALRNAAAPALADWIVESRDAALREGVQPIPPEIRAKLQGYVPPEALDRVRFRVGGGGALSLQQNLFRSGYVPAVTLDQVIVFRREKDAREDLGLWVHELKHVMQYREWGVEGFARRYVSDYNAVEEEARAYRRTWHARTLAAR